MTEKTDKLLKVAEAADRLGISLAVVYALCSARKIRHERHGLKRGKILIPGVRPGRIPATSGPSKLKGGAEE